jgi:hypothetical protein
LCSDICGNPSRSANAGQSSSYCSVFSSAPTLPALQFVRFVSVHTLPALPTLSTFYAWLFAIGTGPFLAGRGHPVGHICRLARLASLVASEGGKAHGQSGRSWKWQFQGFELRRVRALALVLALVLVLLLVLVSGGSGASASSRRSR